MEKTGDSEHQLTETNQSKGSYSFFTLNPGQCTALYLGITRTALSQVPTGVCLLIVRVFLDSRIALVFVGIFGQLLQRTDMFQPLFPAQKDQTLLLSNHSSLISFEALRASLSLFCNRNIKQPASRLSGQRAFQGFVIITSSPFVLLYVYKISGLGRVLQLSVYLSKNNIQSLFLMAFASHKKGKLLITW